jgi:protein-tyrosine phosphatase
MENTMDNYIDIHSHVLYGIDDGSKTIEESIDLLRQYKEMGFNEIVVTPHYIENSNYVANNKEKQKLLKTLKEEGINLYLGNEVFINNDLEELLQKQEISTINNSRYLLIEFPMNQKIKTITNTIYELKIKGIIPIIAHPERYEYVKKDINIVKEWIEEGAILQSNYGSIMGIYGETAKKTIKKLLKQNLISLLATDIHFPNSEIYNTIEKSRKKIKKITGEEKFIELTITNPKKIIKNKEISKN